VDALEKRRKSFNDWYKKNKSRFNAERREKYSSDASLREKYVSRQKEYRKKSSNGIPSKTIELNGNQVEVFRIGYASKFVGRPSATIRSWELAGVIPKATASIGKHRYYTKGQLVLIRELADMLNILVDDHEARKLAMDTKSKEIHNLWSA